MEELIIQELLKRLENAKDITEAFNIKDELESEINTLLELTVQEEIEEKEL